MKVKSTPDNPGVIEEKKLKSSSGYPSAQVLKGKAVVVIECIEEIPCNPCEVACSSGAIKVGTPITNLPVLIPEECTGCGRCIAECPGLAVFVVNLNYSKDKGTVALPYEFLPTPEKGAEVILLTREGKKVGKGEVVKIIPPQRRNHTAVVTVAMDKKLVSGVRTIRYERKK